MAAAAPLWQTSTMTETTVTIRRIRPDDGPRVRDVRLRALRSDPAAFESVYARERDREPEVWATWAATASTGDDQVLFVADRGTAFAGMAGAFRERDDPRALHLVALWVEPESRRLGIARRLVEAVIDWVGSVDADTLHLWVVEGAIAARRLYEQAGFEATDTTSPVVSRPEQTKRLMVHSLRGRGARRVPSGYVELAPTTAAEFDAYATWAVANLAGDLMESAALDLAGAKLEAERRIAGLLPSREVTPRHHVCTVRAGLADEAAGWVWFAAGERDGESVCVLHDLVVFEPFRGHGIGAATIDEVEEWARTQHHTAIVLELFAHQNRARRFLAGLGFEEAEEVPGRVTMLKTLTR